MEWDSNWLEKQWQGVKREQESKVVNSRVRFGKELEPEFFWQNGFVEADQCNNVHAQLVKTL